MIKLIDILKEEMIDPEMTKRFKMFAKMCFRQEVAIELRSDPTDWGLKMQDEDEDDVIIYRKPLQILVRCWGPFHQHYDVDFVFELENEPWDFEVNYEPYERLKKAFFNERKIHLYTQLTCFIHRYDPDNYDLKFLPNGEILS